MAELQKPQVSYGGVPLAGVGAIAWRFTIGTSPNIAVFSVHDTVWKSKMKAKLGKDADLTISTGTGNGITIKKLTLLHEVPSDSPNRVSFVLADLRWRWAYPFISRDYNVPKKTGDRTAKINVPFKAFVTIDQYDYKGYSLVNGEDIWTPKAALNDVLEQISDELDVGFVHRIGSFPIRDEGHGSGEQREFSIQNVTLRDQGDVAVSRLMGYIPGASLWVDPSGIVQIFNGADLAAAEALFDDLPIATYDGEHAVLVDRKFIRPSKVVIFYQREVELLLAFEDDYSGSTSTEPVFTEPYIENVVQTVDDETTVTEFDPIARKSITKTKLPPGTWVEFKAWLFAMDKIKPDKSDNWDFDTIKLHWLTGDLDGALGGGGLDLDEDANVSMRIQAIKQHFRQSFRINRLITDKTRDLLNYRVALVDPVTGARAPSSVWGQACVIPSAKGKMMTKRKDGTPAGPKYMRNVDYLAPSENSSKRIIDTAPGPTRVNMIDRDLGVFRLDWIVSPYGTEQSFIPSHIQGEKTNRPQVPTRDMGKQDDQPIALGVQVESAVNGIFLAPKMKYKILLTIIPGAPNNKFIYHREELTADQVEKIVEGDWRIQAGEGPVLEVFIAPTESSARFAWEKDKEATATISKLLGLDSKDPVDAGIEDRELPGFRLMNEQRELYSHSRSVAVEQYAAFADSLMGRVATPIPENGINLRGNMSGATVQVAAAPSAKINAMHEFPGVQKPISRLAIMTEGARQVVLGLVRFEGTV